MLMGEFLFGLYASVADLHNFGDYHDRERKLAPPA